MNFLRYLWLRFLRLKFTEFLFIISPFWIFTTIFVYQSFYKPHYLQEHPLPSEADRIFRVELLHLHLHSEYVRLQNFFSQKVVTEGGKVPSFNLYFKDSDLALLYSNLPESGKENIISGALILNGKKYQIKARLRGGSYWHWSNPHKSWRIYFQNGEKVFGHSVLDLVNPKLVFSVSDTLAFDFARKIGLWDMEHRTVRVNINNRYSGHSFTLSFLDNDLLHKNKKTSGSIYGIDLDSPRVFDPLFQQTASSWRTGRDWFDYASLYHEKNRKLELYELGKAIRSRFVKNFYSFVINHFDLEKLYKMMALDSILGIFHHGVLTSQRYYYNNKEGKFSPIPWDYLNWLHEETIMFSRNPIYDFTRRDGRLNREFLRHVWQLYTKDLSLPYIKKSIDEKCDLAFNAVKDDPNKDGVTVHFTARSNYTQTFAFNEDYFLSTCKFFKWSISERYKFLDKYFSFPKIQMSYKKEDNFYRVVVGHDAGVGPRVSRFFDEDKELKEVYYDSNNNKIFDSEDKQIGVNGKILFAYNHQTEFPPGLMVKDFEFFFGARNIIHKRVDYLYFIKKAKVKELKLEVLHAFDDTNKTVIKGEEKDKIEVSTFFHYPKEVVVQKSKKKKVLGPGKVRIKSSKEFTEIVEIKPGTEFIISKGQSLSFVNRLIAKGTAESPIFFRSEDDLFGSIAIVGEDSSNSIMENVKISNGNGGFEGLREFTGVLSIYQNKNISLKNIEISSTCEDCVGINLYKVENAKLENILIKNISNDLIRGELSRFSLSNSRLVNTLGNCIELTYSELFVKNSVLSHCFLSGVRKKSSKLKLIDSKLNYTQVGFKEEKKNNYPGVHFKGVLKEFVREK